MSGYGSTYHHDSGRHRPELVLAPGATDGACGSPERSRVRVRRPRRQGGAGVEDACGRDTPGLGQSPGRGQTQAAGQGDGFAGPFLLRRPVTLTPDCPYCPYRPRLGSGHRPKASTCMRSFNR